MGRQLLHYFKHEAAGGVILVAAALWLDW